MNFINRTQELHKLNSLWQQKNAQLVVLYGKRRVGKTELIKHFLSQHTGIYYLADKRTHKEQLLEFSRVVANYFKDEFLSQTSFHDWQQAFLYLKERAKQTQFVVAIDEYSYLTETDKATSSIFQKGWDNHLKNTQAFLIICGSSISMMESEVLAHKAPLFGRTTAILRIEPMDYLASREFFPNKTFTEFMSYYAITGGMPAYMQQFNNYSTATKASQELCWDKLGLYHNEINNLLKQELRTPNNYFAILKAIAYGKTKVSKIAADADLEVQLVNKYLDTLERLQLVKREVQVTEEAPHKSKKGIYVLTENFVRFWFQYVYAFTSDLEIGMQELAQARFSEYSHILESIAYESIARHHLHSLQKQLFPMRKVGRYWNRDVEIDGVGLNHETKQIVFMEAKWSHSQQDMRTLKKLWTKSQSVPWNQGDRNEYFVIYSKAGFAQDLLGHAKANNKVLLVHQDTLVL